MRDSVHVLVVGDQSAAGSDIALLLQRGNYYVATAALERSSLTSMLLRHRPDIVLLHIDAPGGEGLGLCREVASHPALRGLLLIALLADNDPELIAQAIAAGANDFLVQPFNETVLTFRIQQLLAQESQRRMLHDTEAWFRAMVDGIAAGVVLADGAGRVLAMNAALEQLLGYSEDELDAVSLLGYMPGEGLASEMLEVPGRQDCHRVERRFKRSDGGEIDGRLTVTLLRDYYGKVGYVVAVLEDITPYRSALTQLRQYTELFSNTLDGILITDRESNIIDANRGFTRMTGYARSEVLGKRPNILRSGWQGEAFYQQMWSALLGTGSWQGQVWNRRKNGETYPEWLTISAIKNDYGETTNYVAVFSDISMIKENEARMTRLAHLDALTGLPNRLLCQDRLEQAIAQAQRLRTHMAVLFLDLDRFKSVNDTYGHDVGDQLLKAVAKRLHDLLRANDTLARMGGDEFLIVVPLVRDKGAVITVAKKILVALSKPFEVDDHELRIGGSLGISFYPDDEIDAGGLVTLADKAMYKAKQAGRNRYKVHQE